MIVVVPALNAVTNPDDGLTLATAALLLLQVPPASPVLLYGADWPIQSGDAPLTVPALALGLTVNAFDADTGLPQPLFTV